MRNILMISFVAIILSSCATMKMTDLKPEPKITPSLPTLEVRVDLESFESAYTLGSTSSVSSGSVYGRTTVDKNRATTTGIGTAVSTSTMSKDPRIQDAITIFDRDVKDNLTDPFGDSKGFILCKINASNEKINLGWAVLSGVTLMIPNLLGMPIGAYKMTLDVDVEIYNSSQKLIGRYNATASAKKYMALYWGYGKDCARVANIMAFRDAMNIIKEQIRNDHNSLMEKL